MELKNANPHQRFFLWQKKAKWRNFLLRVPKSNQKWVNWKVLDARNLPGGEGQSPPFNHGVLSCRPHFG